ncbi:hypothetical protein EB796_017625 [Bugula neritina]|uniref:Uncharacterized protein n=1 Tax=Bugula neritina TaxID=10212 RepID=A0A7J7JDX4_BUGNE|nr:hypothetical protein EB796_017625 [Bugula neritina]
MTWLVLHVTWCRISYWYGCMSPYHLAFAIGGTSAEMNLKCVKLASTKYFDNLPTSGNEHGRAFRDVELEQKIETLSQQIASALSLAGNTSYMM